jgi:hypothetical protein
VPEEATAAALARVRAWYVWNATGPEFTALGLLLSRKRRPRDWAERVAAAEQDLADALVAHGVDFDDAASGATGDVDANGAWTPVDEVDTVDGRVA